MTTLVITARPQKNVLTAKLYFREHLTKGDAQAQDIEARWYGKGAARLGLDIDRPVSAEAFDRLCDNLHPVTGSRLTVRHRAEDRRVFYDFTASAPKSVSVLATVMDDERLIALHNQAVRVAVAQMEQMAATRVRLSGKDEDRITGEIVAVTVQHDCSRALDPQLHTHIVIFNATYDPVEQRWKALQAREMFDAIHFFTDSGHVGDFGLLARTRFSAYRITGSATGTRRTSCWNAIRSSPVTVRSNFGSMMAVVVRTTSNSSSSGG